MSPSIIPSLIPSTHEMYARNAPSLKETSLCTFLRKMDEEESEIDLDKEEKLVRTYFTQRVLRADLIPSCATGVVILIVPFSFLGVCAMVGTGAISKYVMERTCARSETRSGVEKNRLARLKDKIAKIFVEMQMQYSHQQQKDYRQLSAAHAFFFESYIKYSVLKDLYS